jgi:hypothetical protein
MRRLKVTQRLTVFQLNIMVVLLCREASTREDKRANIISPLKNEFFGEYQALIDTLEHAEPGRDVLKENIGLRR